MLRTRQTFSRRHSATGRAARGGRGLLIALAFALAPLGPLVGVVGLAPPSEASQPTAVTAGSLPANTTAADHQNTVVSDNPANNTPHVLDGRVLAVAEVGDLIILGGRFTQVSSPDGSTTYARDNLVAFNKNTGAISTAFTPSTDDDVTSLIVAPDGQSVYVGGMFDQVNGAASRGVARLRISDGTTWPGWNTPVLTGRIKDMALADNRLWIAGTFTHIDGVRQPALATLDPDTGTLDPFMGLDLEDPRMGGGRQVMKLDIAPNGQKLVAIGNFTTVEGQPRYQVAMLDLTGTTAQLRSWRTNFFTAQCSPSFDSYMRDIDFSPDGSFFAIVTTGAASGGPPGPCDTTSRFESGATGTDIQPSWVTYTGGDTTYSVTVTGAAVYTGGHFRWQNNAFGADRPQRGAVSRPGLAALDPVNGRPLSWNPTRTLGVGVFHMLATDEGLWVASDTDRIGDWEYHARIAFFPLEGGAPVPPSVPGELPGTVYTADRQLAQTVPRQRQYDGQNPPGSPTAAPDGGIDWDDVRGGFMLSGQLYLGHSDGRFDRRTFDGTGYGSANTIDTADQLVYDSQWHGDVQRMTGAFFDNGRIYYTVRFSDALYYRYFTPQSGVIGPRRFTADVDVPGLDLSEVAGMMLDGDELYLGNSSDGALRRVTFADGRVSGSIALISGPGVDGQRWDTRAMYLRSEALPSPEFVDAAAQNANATVHQVAVPNAVSVGDRLLLLLTLNASDRTVGDPTGVTGWTTVGERKTNGSHTVVWSKAAASGDAGTTVSVAVGAWTKGALTVAAYRGTGTGDVLVRSWNSAAETDRTTTHTTPTISGLPGTRLVSYWGEKSSGTTSWSVPGSPANVNVRSQTFGSGGGRVASLLADSSSAVGTAGGVPATTDYASRQATMWSLLLGTNP